MFKLIYDPFVGVSPSQIDTAHITAANREHMEQSSAYNSSEENTNGGQGKSQSVLVYEKTRP